MAMTRSLTKMVQGLSRRRRMARAAGIRADRLRDERRYQAAAEAYGEALGHLPAHSGYHVQCGHMLKESGNPAAAEPHYRIAAKLMPLDPDVPLQLGHLYKLMDRLEEAEASYQDALKLRPHWFEAEKELAALGERVTASTLAPAKPLGSIGDVDQNAQVMAAASHKPLAADLLPRPHEDLLHGHSEGIELRQLGRSERTHWGKRMTLRGIETIRGFCISSNPIVSVQILLNGVSIHQGPAKGGYPLTHEAQRPELRKYVFNAWVDLTGIVRGQYEIQIRMIDTYQRMWTHSAGVVVETALMEEDYATSDGVLTLDPKDPRGVEEQINSRPTTVRPSRRSLFSKPPRTILVQRPDQLGDMVVSVPAIRRIRELFPEARLIGVLSRSNVDLARSLGLFDEIVVTEFGEDHFERRRVMPLSVQEELVRNLERYVIDLAIDLSENAWSRRLLLLAGATNMYGFRAGQEMGNMLVDLEGNTHDRWTGQEVVPHTNKLLGLVEWLGAMTRSEPNIALRTAPTAAALGEFGLGGGTRFAVLHDGARLQFSRWPYQAELAALLLSETDLHVVWITDDADTRERLPATLAGSTRFQLLDRRLPFDLFDALVSECQLFVGNDSGPKHLAALRGAPVVSTHAARNSWNEWGQESGGYILSRKVPCAGCSIHYDPEECGREFACVRGIKAREVFDAAMRLLSPQPSIGELALSTPGLPA